jgi:hypothetical protein
MANELKGNNCCADYAKKSAARAITISGYTL